jgi:hypothetical protein
MTTMCKMQSLERTPTLAPMDPSKISPEILEIIMLFNVLYQIYLKTFQKDF